MARCFYQGVAKDGNGKIIPSATIEVHLAGTATDAKLYTADSGGVSVSSVTSASDGSFTFYLDPSENSNTILYDISISKLGFTKKVYQYVLINVKTDGSFVFYNAVYPTIYGSTNLQLYSNSLKNGLIKFGDNFYFDEANNILVLPDGTYDHPSIVFSGNTIMGFYKHAAYQIGLDCGDGVANHIWGTSGLYRITHPLAKISFNDDLYLARSDVNILQMGLNASDNSAVTQTFKGADSTTDVAGATLALQGGKGSGTKYGPVTIPHGNFDVAEAMSVTEMSAPTGSTNVARIFAKDNGAGKTQLMVIFQTGSAIQIAIEA